MFDVLSLRAQRVERKIPQRTKRGSNFHVAVLARAARRTFQFFFEHVTLSERLQRGKKMLCRLYFMFRSQRQHRR